MIRSRHRIVLTIITLLPWLAAAVPAAAQKVETVDGVRVVHNIKGGLWGNSPKVSLTPVRKIGDIDTEDEHVAFNFPNGVSIDSEGNIYILDTGNARIQKFGPDGTYIATIGRKGQGPGEFIMPDEIAFDKDGNLVVSDMTQARIHVIIGGGREVRSIVVKEEMISSVRPLPSGDFAGKASTYSIPIPGQQAKTVNEMRLFRRIAADGRVAGSFGGLTDFGEPVTNGMGNTVAFDVDSEGDIFVSFEAQNRIEKYAPDGTLVWRADRPLAYSTEVKKKGGIDSSGGRFAMSAPEMNTCAVGIGVDGRGRIWVVTYARQLRKEEKVQTSATAVSESGGIGTVTFKTEGNTDLRTTDALKLEVFDRDGLLLGEIPIAHFADVIRVFGDQLFLIDRDRGVTVYQYKIVEK
jgi:sugar lactone lactonase YvrE